QRCASAWANPVRSMPDDPAWSLATLSPNRKEDHVARMKKFSAVPTIRHILVVGILAALTMFAPRPARAGRLGADVIALFPKDVGEFAYADLKKARTLPWFPQLQQQMLPERFRQFEKFLASAGVDPNTQVEELAWGLVAEMATSKKEGAEGKKESAEASALPTGEQI